MAISSNTPLPGTRQDYAINEIQDTDGTTRFAIVDLATGATQQVADVEGLRFAQAETDPLFPSLAQAGVPPVELLPLMMATRLANSAYGNVAPPGWHPLSAADFDRFDAAGATASGPTGGGDDVFVDNLRAPDVSYTFLTAGPQPHQGFYTGSDPTQRVGAEATAFVGTAVMPAFDGQGDARTLAIAVRGTDNAEDIADYFPFASHYAKFDPLVDGIVDFVTGAREAGMPVEQIVITGHSLGAATAQFFADDPRIEALGVPIHLVTFGSPGTEAEPSATVARVVNIVHTDDPFVAARTSGPKLVDNLEEILFGSDGSDAFRDVADRLGLDKLQVWDLKRIGPDILVERPEADTIFSTISEGGPPAPTEHETDLLYDSAWRLQTAVPVAELEAIGTDTYFALGAVDRSGGSDIADTIAGGEWAAPDAPHRVYGLGGDDRIELPSVQGHRVDGGDGTDTVVYAGPRVTFIVAEASDGSVLVSQAGVTDGPVDQLRNVELLGFQPSSGLLDIASV